MAEPLKKQVESVLLNARFVIPVVIDPELYYPAPSKTVMSAKVALDGAGDEIAF